MHRVPLQCFTNEWLLPSTVGKIGSTARDNSTDKTGETKAPAATEDKLSLVESLKYEIQVTKER